MLYSVLFRMMYDVCRDVEIQSDIKGKGLQLCHSTKVTLKIQ